MASSTGTAVFGIYKNSAQAESAVHKAEIAVNAIVEFRTVAGGFTHTDISVLLPDAKSSSDFAQEKHTKPPEGTTSGVTTGGVNGSPGRLAGIAALIGIGIPESEAKVYEGLVKDGGVLLSVHCETFDQTSRALDLLKQTGAEDISSASENAVRSQNVDAGTASTKV